MSKSLSTLVNQNTFASTSANLCTQHEYWRETSVRTSHGGNRSHNVSLPIILKKTKVGQILQYSCNKFTVSPYFLIIGFRFLFH